MPFTAVFGRVFFPVLERNDTGKPFRIGWPPVVIGRGEAVFGHGYGGEGDDDEDGKAPPFMVVSLGTGFGSVPESVDVGVDRFAVVGRRGSAKRAG